MKNIIVTSYRLCPILIAVVLKSKHSNLYRAWTSVSLGFTHAIYNALTLRLCRISYLQYRSRNLCGVYCLKTRAMNQSRMRCAVYFVSEARRGALVAKTLYWCVFAFFSIHCNLKEVRFLNTRLLQALVSGWYGRTVAKTKFSGHSKVLGGTVSEWPRGSGLDDGIQCARRYASQIWPQRTFKTSLGFVCMSPHGQFYLMQFTFVVSRCNYERYLCEMSLFRVKRD